MMYERLIEKLRDDTMWKNCEFDFIYSYMHEAADAIEELSKKLFYAELSEAHTLEIQKALLDSVKIPRWVPVEERLPEDGAEVLAWSQFGFAYVDLWIDGAWKIDGLVNGENEVVTHWMPLPKPPEEKP